MDGLIKIGDFGLVTNTLEDHSHADTNVNNTKKKIHKHTNEVGTQLYMSPEQVIAFIAIRTHIAYSRT